MDEDTVDRLRAQIDEFRRAREGFTQRQFAGSSDDERISVTVDASGRLVDIAVDPRVWRTRDAEALRQSIITANVRACAKLDVALEALRKDEFADAGSTREAGEQLRQAVTDAAERPGGVNVRGER